MRLNQCGLTGEGPWVTTIDGYLQNHVPVLMFDVHIRIEQICQFRWVSHGYKKKKNASFLVTFLPLWCSILGRKAMHGYGYQSGGVDGCL